MEEMILRVCLVAACLLNIKEHTVFEEQDDIVVDMQEREHLLQKEGAKLEQEVHSVAMEPPQVSQSHRRLTKGEGGKSDVQQILPNGKVEEPHKLQIPQREGRAILHHNHNQPLTEDNWDEFQTDKTVEKLLQKAPNVDHIDLPPEKGKQSEIAHADQNEAKQILPNGNKMVSQNDEDPVSNQEDPHPLNGPNALVADEAPSVFSEETQPSHLNQEWQIVKQKSEKGKPEEDTEIPQEDHKSFFKQIVNTLMYSWSQDSHEEHASLENESLEVNKQLQMKVVEEQTDENMSNQENLLTLKERPHAHQKPSSPSQVQTKTSESESLGSENIYTWCLWKVLSLLSIIRLLRKLIGGKAKSSERARTILQGKKLSGYTDISAQISVLDHEVLNDFYKQCVHIPPSTCGQICDFVEGFMDELLEAARNSNNKENNMEMGYYVGIGSLYELWATGKAVVCDVYVPITAPSSYSFETELHMPEYGRIKLMKAESISNGCPCSNGRVDDEDMLCLLHSHHEAKSVIMDAVGGPLCQENTPFLSKTQVIKWFRKTISKAWAENSHKYDFELAFRNSVAPGAMKVRLRSGQAILFNITPVVQVKGSDMYLVSYLSSDQINISDTHWSISLTSYENALLQHFSKSLPTGSCHVQCLQILSFLHKQQNRLTGKCGLTSYHLKIALLHLLLVTKSEEWKSDQLAGRLTDILLFLEQSLHECKLDHSLLRNPVVPSSISLPKVVQVAKPTNIFLPLVSDKKLYFRTVQHLQELVKNAPVLIHEYVLLKCSGP